LKTCAEIERGIALVEHAKALIERADRWAIVTPAQMAVVTITPRARSEELAALAARIADDGHATVTSTRLHARAALRLCTINPGTTTEDIASTLEPLGVGVATTS
jgi:aromatic-L-amino-acid/L-tryptophan decarboxylase